jgi:hypothetical protein
MRLVGDALKEYKQMSVCVGIASYGPLDGKASLEAGDNGQFKLGSAANNSVENPKGTINNPYVYTGTSLDKNHSHYILVDAGKYTAFGAEIEVRHELEDFVSFRRDAAGKPVVRLVHDIVENQQSDSKRSIPVICVCFGGGPGSVKTLQDAMYSGRPIILVKGSRRITDCVVALVELKTKFLKQEAKRHSKSSVQPPNGATSPRFRRAELRVQQDRLIDEYNKVEFKDSMNAQKKAGKNTLGSYRRSPGLSCYPYA